MLLLMVKAPLQKSFKCLSLSYVNEFRREIIRRLTFPFPFTWILSVFWVIIFFFLLETLKIRKIHKFQISVHFSRKRAEKLIFFTYYNTGKGFQM